MSYDHQLLCAAQLLITVAVLAFALWGWQAFKATCKWIGAKVADAIWGSGRPR